VNKDKINPIVSIAGLVLIALQAVALYFYHQFELTFAIALPIMALLLTWNIRFTVHITVAFASAVGWMVIAIYNFPQTGNVERIWEFADFLPAVICAINFILGAWLYIYNRVRW